MTATSIQAQATKPLLLELNELRMCIHASPTCSKWVKRRYTLDAKEQMPEMIVERRSFRKAKCKSSLFVSFVNMLHQKQM